MPCSSPGGTADCRRGRAYGSGSCGRPSRRLHEAQLPDGRRAEGPTTELNKAYEAESAPLQKEDPTHPRTGENSIRTSDSKPLSERRGRPARQGPSTSTGAPHSPMTARQRPDAQPGNRNTGRDGPVSTEARRRQGPLEVQEHQHHGTGPPAPRRRQPTQDRAGLRP